jgi:hypothetical protein
MMTSIIIEEFIFSLSCAGSELCLSAARDFSPHAPVDFRVSRSRAGVSV